MDSCDARANTYAYAGSLIDEMVGRTTMSFATNFTPDGFAKSSLDTLFGLNPVADSMFLLLDYVKEPFFGDTTQKIEVLIYELQNLHLDRNRKFYTNMDMTPYYDASKPIVKFKTNGQKRDTMYLPRWFFSKLITPELNTPGDKNPYRVDTLFHRKFNGFYVKVNPITSGEGLIPTFNLNASVSGMTLYYHNDYKDTTAMNFTFYQNDPTSTSRKYLPYSSAINIAQHDYSYSDPSQGGIDPLSINNLTTESKTCYIQGAGGVAARVVIDMEYIKALKEKVSKPENGAYKHIALHKAELRWKVPQKSLLYYTDSFDRLILYLWSKRLTEVIPDYNYTREQSSITSNPEPIGGYLSRSVGYYSQDITSHMQRIISGSQTNPNLNLMPSYLYSYDPLRSVVSGSADPLNAPELILTYTLLR